MKNPLFEDKDYTLWWLLFQAQDTLFKARQKELRQYGISPEEAAVLFIVQCLDNQAIPSEISRWLFRKPHTVSGILNRMETKRLVSKTKDLPKKNLVRVSLTDKGEQAFYQATKIESVHQIMSSLSEQEHQQLRSHLETLRGRALKELGIDTKPPFPQCQ